ncbi:MAG: substrate-binding domain-containing protein, partial [Melioribacteraceae bacterium]|nr:substrate-binding domain-containing protein [Melioribacteraceae bacterium]
QPKNKSWEKEQFIMANWLKNLPKPIGVMACNDDRGQHVLEACKIAEIHVPEELAVIGVDNDALICDLSDPPLTSIALNTLDAGFKTAELLDQMINGLEMDGQEIMVSPTHVVKRHSTDILAINDHNLITSLAYIKENYRDKITVSDILKVTSVNRRSLEGKFKIILGRSIMDEVKRLRIDQMCKLLIESDMSISEITALFTFTKIEHISRYFRQEKQISMREFRKRLKRC